MFYAMAQAWALPCGRFLFWSKTKTFVQTFVAALRYFWTLEDTLAGYMFNDLLWCGQEDNDGFDFGSCPGWSACERHPVYSLWRRASQNVSVRPLFTHARVKRWPHMMSLMSQFAEMACGNVTVLLNGSVFYAFNRESMFGSVELDSLDPCRVDHVNIKVVTDRDGPFMKSCSRGSVLDLIEILRSRGFRWTCADNDRTAVAQRLPADYQERAAIFRTYCRRDKITAPSHIYEAAAGKLGHHISRGDFRSESAEERMKRGVCIAAVVLLLVVVVAITLGVTLSRTFNFLRDFYRQVSPVRWVAPITTPRDKTMFWSKTKDVVHAYNDKTKCFVTMKDTLLGSVLDNLIWCGEEGSSETFTWFCPDWKTCKDNEENPVESFWTQGSAKVICRAAARGDATVMLDGNNDTPFDIEYFLETEVPTLKLNSEVTKLTVVLVTKAKPVSTCQTCLNVLRRKLGSNIGYECKEVSETRISECASNNDVSCTNCW
ncbi:ADP-ribosyl cyclase/cyclic ADP-ribose hydrolase 1 [Takifugu flavidus]|uniref:ADP-ribosyl cyclase/cyclic ADP-ribose hydrolase n=1 Tax=Takifugu flavidus TaxID=433684 RepID=A0A5C6MFC1_9TELE|nr:ADP-ribosyl cyclase/cyclic ADP-ribose hydrolase 1 [Takifugu flavidus]